MPPCAFLRRLADIRLFQLAAGQETAFVKGTGICAGIPSHGRCRLQRRPFHPALSFLMRNMQVRGTGGTVILRKGSISFCKAVFTEIPDRTDAWGIQICSYGVGLPLQDGWAGRACCKVREGRQGTCRKSGTERYGLCKKEKAGRYRIHGIRKWNCLPG